MATPEDRRKRKRVSLQWPVRPFRPAKKDSIDSKTENLTSEGFYCVSREPFHLGEQLECVIVIPAGSFGSSESPVRLRCRVKVTRVESKEAQSGFGLGCHIEDYDLLTNSRHRSMGGA